MIPKPKGTRKIFWTLWNWSFNYRLKKAFKKLEKKGSFGPRTVGNITTKMLNAEAQMLYDKKAIAKPLLYWKGAWVMCEVKK